MENKESNEAPEDEKIVLSHSKPFQDARQAVLDELYIPKAFKDKIKVEKAKDLPEVKNNK